MLFNVRIIAKIPVPVIIGVGKMDPVMDYIQKDKWLLIFMQYLDLNIVISYYLSCIRICLRNTNLRFATFSQVVISRMIFPSFPGHVVLLPISVKRIKEIVMRIQTVRMASYVE